MFYYPNCIKLPIGKIDDNTVFLDFELDADYPAYLIRLYCATDDGCQYKSRLVSILEPERLKGRPKIILKQYYKTSINNIK